MIRTPRPLGARLLAIPAAAWLIVFFLAPLGVVAWYSLGYKPSIFATHANDVLSFDRYAEVFSSEFLPVFGASLWVGVAGTLLCLIIALPLSYWMSAKASSRWRSLALVAVMIPFWTNFLVRTIGWQIILAPEGALSQALLAIGITSGGLDVLYTREAVLLGVVYNYLPMMVLPLYVAFERVPRTLREASNDLGAGRVATFLHVTLPIAAPGIAVGVLLVYIPLMGDYVTAAVLGGAQGAMVGQLVAAQFQTALNWALGSAMAIVLIGTILASVGLAYGLYRLARWPLRRLRRLRLEEAA